MPPLPPTTPANVVYPITVAKRRAWPRQEAAPSGGVVLDDVQTWIIPDVLFPAGVSAKPGDVIVEITDQANEEQPGMRWTVLEITWNKNRWTRHFLCTDRGLSSLADTIKIERPKITYDAAGVATKQFPSDASNPGGLVIYNNLPARVQLLAKPEEDEMGMRGSAGHYEVTLPYDIQVTREDRILLVNGMYLDIMDYTQPMRLDALPLIECRRKI